MKKEIKIFYSQDWLEYELLDTGAGQKLERFGEYVFIRPYEDAVWSPDQKITEWKKAHGKFISSKGGEKVGWKFGKDIEPSWSMSYKNIKWQASPSSFRHLSFFPEQAPHWDFIEAQIKKAARPIKFLNLFGYTGVASLFALRAGAEVTHLDASKQSLDLAKENQKLNPELMDKPMRIILDDALKFLAREEKRGNKYDAVIMDPPKFGRGPKGEVWKIEEMLPKLLEAVRKVLTEQPLFVILTSYATETSSLALGYALESAMSGLNGKAEQGLPRLGLVEAGELCIKEKSKGRLIPLANTAVWSAIN